MTSILICNIRSPQTLKYLQIFSFLLVLLKEIEDNFHIYPLELWTLSQIASQTLKYLQILPFC